MGKYVSDSARALPITDLAPIIHAVFTLPIVDMF